ncbi:MAG: DUF3012 domain-containing protein [Luminiphilus sp.]|nr:DUF3012 domain-containing protein [Luminiphilus sp.]
MTHSKSIRAFFYILICASLGALGGCADKPGSEGWCNTMGEKKKSEWTGSDAKTFATHCVLETTTIGSEAWCEDLKGTAKGEWTTQEVADFAQYCVVDQVTQ